MNIWPVMAVLSGQSRLGGTKIRTILNIALISFYDIRPKNNFDETLDTNEYPIPWPIFDRFFLQL